MTTTGTTAFNPGTGDLVLNAFSRIQLTSSMLTTEHLLRASTEANLSLVKLSNKQPNLWSSELGSQALSQGTPTYTLPITVVDIIICYLSVTSGGVTTDRVLGPISTTDYASFPDKTVQDYPTSFWFNRQITPQITMWPVPDGNATYTLKYRYLRQLYDAGLKSGTTMDLPYRYLDAFMSDLAYRLAMHFKPESAVLLKQVADEAWLDAASEDVEHVPMMVSPGLGGYYR